MMDALEKAVRRSAHKRELNEAVAAERERCARVAEGTAEFVGGVNFENICHKIAANIREANIR